MSRNSRSNTAAADVPAALRPATLRAGLTLAVAAALTAFAIRLQAQVPQPRSSNVTAHLDVAESVQRNALR